MKKLALVAVLVAAVVTGCKKKEDTAAAGSGSAPAMAGSGSGSAPAMAGSGSGSATAMAAGSGSSGSAGSAVAAAGSGSAAASGSGSAAPPAEAKNWDCKKLCTEAVKCKDKDFKSEKECEDDCTKVMHDTTGKYTNGSIEGVPFYSCANTAKDCAALKKCTPGAK